ncbi:coiled-coil domain-containing protein 60 isoform X2 [Strigops habroptila]|uniref:coiled-coil domain-containing protein 60 isoform X2 n=1 Tax=Strigops habroptila TaxID=2489341 RepID=UPI0011CF1741|nr:coiled-coil domain-containing protein 60 isoform X2 [Strigops habroptila]
MSVSKNCRVEAPMAADAGKSSSRLKAPAGPEPPKNTRVRVLSAPNVLNPKEFMRIEALPGFDQKEGKVLARSKTIYKSSEPPREQVFWENYHRRQKQFDKGLFTPLGKPYLELGEILYTDPKQLTLYALGQLTEEPVEKTPKEVAEVTTDKRSSKPESDAPEAVKRPSPLTETGEELRTLSEALASSRHHVNSVKRGGGYFRILQQESLERKNALEASQQAQTLVWRTDFEPPMYSLDVEGPQKLKTTCSQAEGNHLGMSEKKKMTLQSFIPAQTNLLIPSSPEAKSEHLFRQLCVIHWLLEALTLESNSSMRPILTCWNPKDCGGCKKRVKEEEELKLATYMWEHFITKKKKYTWKAGYRLLSRTINKKVTPGFSQFSSQSSPRGQTPQGSDPSTVHCSEDNIKINDVSEPAQAKERQPRFLSLQKSVQIAHGEISKDVCKEKAMVKKTGPQCLPTVQDCSVNMRKDSQTPGKQRPRKEGCQISSFVKSKANLCADMRQRFIAVREEAACCLHDILVSLERKQEERCYRKYEAMKQSKNFRKELDRIRQLSMRVEREHDEDELNWAPLLLARLPESVKNDHYIQKILKKLEKYGKNRDLKIDPDAFLKVLDELRVWELCSPEIAAAAEFVRESIVRMPEADFSKWFQTKVAPHSARIPSPSNSSAD